MYNRIIGKEINKNDLSVEDIKNICLEIAKSDPKAHSFFNKKNIKSKYTKPINKMVEELEKAIRSGDVEKVNKIFKKNDGIMQRYCKLRSGINIRVRKQGDYEEFVKIEETQGKGDVSALGLLYAKAKQNTRNDAEYKFEMAKRDKESEKMQKIIEEEERKREEKIVEANEEKARKNWYNARENADDMSNFKIDLRKKAVDFDEQVKSQYGDEAARYREQEKNPYSKQLEDTEEPNI